MNSMEIDRRHFLFGSVLALTAGTRALMASAGDGETADLVSACRRPGGGFAILLLTLDGCVVREIALNARGHDIAIDRHNGCAVAFARRPGLFALAFGLDGGKEPQLIAAAPDRHFFGHGAFSPDGRLLYATEHDAVSGQGVLGIYDVAAGFKRTGEFATHGIGPHEVILLADGRTLAVANGGIATDPEAGREKLNIEEMEPSLVFIDRVTGDLQAEHALPGGLHLLSIRHLAADRGGCVWFGGQWEGSLETAPELVGCASVSRALRLIEPAEPRGVALKGYIGSVAMHQDGRLLAASAPRAGRIVFIDTVTQTVHSEAVLADGCGVAALDRDTFAMSSGHGVVRQQTPGGDGETGAVLEGVAFDNHLRFLG